MATSLQQMAATITERSRVLINNDLKRICKEEGTSQTGNKATLQARVIGLINNAVYRNDAEALRRLQHRVQHRGDAPPPATSSSPAASSYSQPPPAQTNGYNMANGFQAYSPYPPPSAPPRPQYFFKDSPFFEIRQVIQGNIALEASPSHRQNCTRTIALTDEICARLRDDPTLRLLLFSAAEQPLAPYTRLDIAFPSQIEVRVNGEEIKANYKGLKNKPGSTRPADITNSMRTSPANYRNTVTITYALTQKKYNLSIYMAKKHTVEQLTQRIKQRNVITRHSVLNEMMRNANDPDIELGSSVMSLKDPISTLRIKTPCRSTLCTHNQCFDAESFLQLQEQAPTWTCPICSKTISYEGLAVDQYVEDILSKARSADQVTIQASGEWSLDKEPSPPRRNGYGAHDDDSDEDLVEVSDYRIAAIKTESRQYDDIQTPVSLNTPSLQSRETSTAAAGRSNKRTSEVVDLTLSEDDEEPVRPAKKVAYHTPTSLPDPTRRYQLPAQSHSATHSRPLPGSWNNMHSRADYPRPPSTPPDRSGYGSYRQPPPRHSYGGQGTSQYPTYLGSSP